MRLSVPTFFFGFALAACGAESGGETRTLREWNAGDTDPFGCPVVDPAPWEGNDVHQDYCGDGCVPLGGRGGSDDENGLSFFVACQSDDIPAWPGGDYVSAITVCSTNPVNGKDYVFANPESAWPLAFLCWPPCGAEVLSVPSENHEIPEECFEEPI